jgi:hypothetical protein
MHIESNYTYEVFGIPKGCRNPRARYAAGAAPFKAEVREISALDAPVAFRLKVGVLERSTLEIRWFDERLWKRAHVNQTGPKIPLDAEHLVAQMHSALALRPRSPGPAVAVLDTAHYRRIHSTTEEALITQMQDFVHGYLLIEGVFYTETSEPRYVAQTFGLGANHGGTALLTTAYYNSNLSKKAYFRADALAAASAYATSLAQGRGDDRSLPIEPHSVIEVLIPEAVRCRPDLEAGEGDPFLNDIEAMIQGVGGDPCVAAAGIIATLAQSLSKH